MIYFQILFFFFLLKEANFIQRGQTRDLADFENIITPQKHQLLEQLLPQYDTEAEQVKICIVKWIQNFGDVIALQQWKGLQTKDMQIYCESSIKRELV